RVTLLEREHRSRPDTMSCPFCAETIKAWAKICSYCQRELPVRIAFTASVPAAAPALKSEVLSAESFSRCRWCGAQVYATAESCDACFRPLRNGRGFGRRSDTGNPVATSDLGLIVGWGFGLLFLLFGIAHAGGRSLIGALISLVMAALCVPQTR